MDSRVAGFHQSGVIILLNLLMIICTSGGEIKGSTGVKFHRDGKFALEDDLFHSAADDKISSNMDSLSTKVVTFSNVKDIFSLEIIQHEKVKLVLENGNQDTVTANLQAPTWFDTDHIHYDVTHTDMETLVTLWVGNPQKSAYTFQSLIHVILLVVVSVFLFVCLFLIFRRGREKIWLRANNPCSSEERNKQDPIDESCDHCQPMTQRDQPGKTTVVDQRSVSMLNSSDSQSLCQNSAQAKECSAQCHCSCSAANMTKDKGQKSRSHGSKGQDHGAGGQALAAFTFLGISLLGLFLLVSLNHQSTNQMFQTNSDRPVLKMIIPPEKHIRKVRSYSSDPDLSDVSVTDDGSLSLVSRLQLLDLSHSCHDNISECKTRALCDKTMPGANFLCRCNLGYFLEGLSCKACSTSCPPGHYMAQQCSAESDVVCKPCKQCRDTEYSAAPCTTTQDTLCIDVSFPLNQIFRYSTMTEDDLISLNVSMSANVFLEQLKNIKKLETSLFVANNKQEMQFVYSRPSGLQVEVDLSNVYLIPEYIDLEHTDDLPYITRSPNFPMENLREINNITQTFCRHPLPDYYSLILAFANSTTVASEVTCNPRVQQCPEGYKDGDTFIAAELDRECPKKRSQKTFRNSPNTFLCMDNPRILGSVFKEVVKNSVPLKFPSQQCENFSKDCENCLAGVSCHQGSDCCKRTCYNRRSCKSLYTSTCPPSPVECIEGVVTKFGIFPRFASITSKFACHLRYHPPRMMYRVSYQTSIPSMQFYFKTRHKDVMFHNKSHHEDGTDQADFLSMHHFTVINLSEEVVLLRQKYHDSANYSLHRLKEPWEFQRPGDFDITQSIEGYRTAVQFERPFLYSTSNWKENGCNKNVSQIYPNQTVYKEEGIELLPPIRNKTSDSFVYEIRENSTAPHIRFYAQENVSVMSYYRDEMKNSRIMGAALKGTIRWLSDIRCWLVTISGNLTDCPGCFTLELFDQVKTSRVVMYDMLVNCPHSFNINFTVERTDVNFQDIFIVVINDSVTSHKLVLTSIHAPQFFRMADGDLVAMPTTNQWPWTPILVILAGCCFMSLILIVVYLLIDAKETHYPPIDLTLPKPDLGAGITLLKNLDKTRPSLTLQTKLIVVVLVVLYIVYAVLFTFSAIFGMMHLVQGPETGSLTIVTNTSARIYSNIHSQLQEMVAYEEKEARRLVDTVKDQQLACSAHLKEFISKGLPDVQKAFKENLRKVFSNNGSIHNSVKDYIQGREAVYQGQIDHFISEFNQTVETNLHKVHTTYTSYLSKVAENPWFDFPRKIFLQQQRKTGSDIKEVLTEFLTWLEIDKVQEIVDIKGILMKKFLEMMPRVNFSSLPDDISGEVIKDDFNTSVAVNWFKFVSTPDNIIQSPASEAKSRDRTKYWSAQLSNMTATDSEPLEKENVIQNIRSVLYPVFITVFLVLDLFLLIYRFSWMLRSIQHFKTGIEERVPFDSMTRKIHFILTGRDIPRPGNCLDHPYDYYIQNKENIWKDNTDLYFQYLNASAKSKEDILRELLQHKRKSKPVHQTEVTQENCCAHFVSKFLKLLYRFFISPVFWRFILICVFVLLICLATKAIDDLVTMDSAMFLMDTEAMIPILQRQVAITHMTVSQYSAYLNDILTEYTKLLDSEIQVLNTIMVDITAKQAELLKTLVADMCNIRGDNSVCSFSPDLVTATVTSCNFLPLHIQPYAGFHEDKLTQFIQAELSPLVTNLRDVLFFMCYLLLAFAGVMLLCQIVARIIYVYLIKQGHLRTSKIYQLPSTLEWAGQQSFRDEKDIYVSQSLIAESCESGVYDLTT